MTFTPRRQITHPADAPREFGRGDETASGLWTPRGSTVAAPYAAGADAATGRRVVVHRFRFHDARSGRSQTCHVPASAGASPAEIEDLAARAFENFLEEVRGLSRMRRPTPRERREIGAAIREFRAYAARRRASSLNRIYHPAPIPQGPGARKDSTHDDIA